MSAPRFRILALDIDGTLLDRSGTLRPRTIEAVTKARTSGIRPILCTGRRYRKAFPIAELLGIDDPIVCNSGAIVKDPRTHRTLWRADLRRDVLSAVLEVFRRRDEPALSFTDRPPEDFDFLVASSPTGRPLFDDYLDRNRPHADVIAGWTENPSGNHYHLCAIGTRDSMLDFERDIHQAISGEIRTFVQKSPRYAGTMCEILRHDASKWSALLQIADQWGVDPAEICAVGDDMNDVPMIEGAGLGVAMGHSNPSVLAVANKITGTDEQEGVAMLIEELLLD